MSGSPSSSKPADAQPPPSGETVIASPHPDLTTFSRPFSRFGIIPVGGRSTAIVLQNPPNTGSLWVLASTPLDGPTRDKITSLGGKVKYLVAPDFVHHLYIPEWSREYPDAECIGVEGLDAKRKDVKWKGLYGVDDEGTTKYGFEDEIQARYWPTFSNRDLTFHHKASGSLIVADLLFNLPPHEQYAQTKAGKATSPIPFLASFMKYLAPTTAFHKWFLGTAGAMNAIPKACEEVGHSLQSPGGTSQERKQRFAKDAEVVAGWDFQRIIPCHGDLVQGGDVRQKWIDTFVKVSGRARRDAERSDASRRGRHEVAVTRPSRY